MPEPSHFHQPSRRFGRAVSLAVIVAILGGCDRRRVAQRRIITRPDPRPAFTVQTLTPFVIELGRGGMGLLDVVHVERPGSVELSRFDLARGRCEYATLRLSPRDVAAVAQLANAQRLTQLARSYADPDVADGTQWVLWIRQSQGEKSIYFNNAFPAEATAFATGLDAILRAAGSEAVAWHEESKQTALDRQRSLWDRLDRAK